MKLTGHSGSLSVYVFIFPCCMYVCMCYGGVGVLFICLRLPFFCKGIVYRMQNNVEEQWSVEMEKGMRKVEWVWVVRKSILSFGKFISLAGLRGSRGRKLAKSSPSPSSNMLVCI